ncbi:MAG: gamma carbonic anhydrase family protein [Actinobacteria bacterium]|nr:gamma carbonic anhydrase family protein [Actinomycetota bacterium]
MPIYAFEGREPRVASTAYVDPSAVIIGKVYVGEGCYIGPGAVMRGDWGAVVMMEGSNLQDNAVIHARPEETTYLGPNSHVGHGAVLHGCRLEGHVLVGMNAVINDGAVLEEGCIVASGAVVMAGMHVPERTMVAGVPAVIKGDVDETRDTLLWIGHRFYQSLPPRYRESSSELTLEEAQRLYDENPEP